MKEIFRFRFHLRCELIFIDKKLALDVFRKLPSENFECHPRT